MIDPLLEPLVASLLAEAKDVCARMTRDVLALEQAELGADRGAGHYESLRRGLHNLKGTSASLGLDDVAALAHALEDRVAPFARTTDRLGRGDADALLTGFDELVSRIRALGSVAEPGVPSTRSGVAADPEPPAEDALGWRVASDQVRAIAREVEHLRELRMRLDDRRRGMVRALGSAGQAAAADGWSTSLIGWSAGARADSEDAAAIVSALEESVKAICTEQVATMTQPLHRAVRDLCRQSGKEARLSVVGAEISLDRRMVELLRGALVQLVRNAIDHGVERPEERIRAGKHREASIVIRVEQQGNLVFVEVSDDGRGLDAAEIRSAAVRRGIAEDELAKMSPAEVQGLVFTAGFSTREAVTGVSGRGVGLDLVRSAVRALEGRIDVESTPGGGARFAVTVPTTLGSSPVIVVRCEDQRFGILLHCIEGFVGATAATVVHDGPTMRLEHRDRTLALDDLGAMLGLRAPLPCAGGEPLVVVRAQAESMAFRVDEVHGDLDLRIQPLPEELRAIPAYQGASALPDGDLLLVLRPEWLTTTRARVPGGATNRRRALVVDDSLTARAVHRAMLEAGGFVVHAVAGADQALTRVGQARYDVVVSDVAMEPIDGPALVKRLRALPSCGALPVVLVSAHDSPELRARASEVGADGFISKRDCAEGRLLAEVARAIAQRASS